MVLLSTERHHSSGYQPDKEEGLVSRGFQSAGKDIETAGNSTTDAIEVKVDCKKNQTI